MRHLAITGIVTASWIPTIISGSDMRATPPWTRMSAGTRSSAITATAPDASAIFACSALTTSMITPPLSISARPLLTRIVPYSAMGRVYPGLSLQTPRGGVGLVALGGDRPDEYGVPVRAHDVRDVRPEPLRSVRLERVLGRADGVGVCRERDRQDVARRRGCSKATVVGKAGDEPDLGRLRGDAGEPVFRETRRCELRGEGLRVADAAARCEQRQEEQDPEPAGHAATVAALLDGPVEESRDAAVVTGTGRTPRRAHARKRGPAREPPRRPARATALGVRTAGRGREHTAA